MSKRAWFNGANGILQWNRSTLFEGIGTTGDFTIKFKTNKIGFAGGGHLLNAGTSNIIKINNQTVNILDVTDVVCFSEDDSDEHTLEFSRASGVLTIKCDDVVKYSAANSYDWAAVDAAALADGKWYLGKGATSGVPYGIYYYGFLSEFEFYNGATRILYLPLTADYTDQSGNAIAVENVNNRVEMDEMDKVTFFTGLGKNSTSYVSQWHHDCMYCGNFVDLFPFPAIGSLLYLRLPTPIPAGATITGAYMKMKTAESVNSLSKIRFRACFSNDATSPKSLESRYDASCEEIIATELLRGTDFGGVINNLTVSHVDWDDVEFEAETEYNSPSLVSIVQELANLGQVSHIALFMDDFEERSARDIWTKFSVGGESFHPELVVTYTTGGPYNVVYRDNGGTGSPATGSHTSGSTVTVIGTVPSREGYTFTGWNTAADGSGTSYAGGDTFVITSHVVLYAQWASIHPISSDVFYVGYSTAASSWAAIPVPEMMYNPAAGNASGMGMTRLGFAVRFVLSTPIPMGTTISAASLKGIGGLHLSGFQSGDGTRCRIRAQKNIAPAAIEDLEDYLERRALIASTGQLTDASVDVENMDMTNGEAFEIEMASVLQELADTGDVSSIVLFIDDHDAMTLYSNHVYSIYHTMQLSYETTYTVTYEGNGNTGGSVPVDGNTYAPGAGVTVLGNVNSLTRTDYVFSKWNTAADGSGTDYNPGDTFNIAANTTLYAKWQVVTPNVVTLVAWDTVNECGKTGNAANITVRGVADGVEYTLAAPAVTEVDAANLPGIYTVSLTDSENDCYFNTIGGITSSSGIVIKPTFWVNPEGRRGCCIYCCKP